jgi:ribonucleoside-triphosphate reductase
MRDILNLEVKMVIITCNYKSIINHILKLLYVIVTKESIMEVIKRDGHKDVFDENKIISALTKTFIEVDGEITEESKTKILNIANSINKKNKLITIEEIQNIVEDKLMASNRKDVARAYIRYRYKRELVRQGNTTDKSIKELIEGTNDYWNTENSNKNPRVVTTQRDYLAGITSTDIATRFLLPDDIVKAHDEGIIHFHNLKIVA